MPLWEENTLTVSLNIHTVTAKKKKRLSGVGKGIYINNIYIYLYYTTETYPSTGWTRPLVVGIFCCSNTFSPCVMLSKMNILSHMVALLFTSYSA